MVVKKLDQRLDRKKLFNIQTSSSNKL